MGKIIRKFYDFGCFFFINFCTFKVFLAQKEKHPKITVLTKWKLKEKNKLFYKD